MKRNLTFLLAAIILLSAGFWGGRIYQKHQTEREISTFFGVQKKTPQQIHDQQVAAQEAVKEFQAKAAASSEASKVAIDDAMLKAQQDQAAALQQINQTLYEKESPRFANDSPDRIAFGSTEELKKRDSSIGRLFSTTRPTPKPTLTEEEEKRRQDDLVLKERMEKEEAAHRAEHEAAVRETEKSRQALFK